MADEARSGLRLEGVSRTEAAVDLDTERAQQDFRHQRPGADGRVQGRESSSRRTGRVEVRLSACRSVHSRAERASVGDESKPLVPSRAGQSTSKPGQTPPAHCCGVRRGRGARSLGPGWTGCSGAACRIGGLGGIVATNAKRETAMASLHRWLPWIALSGLLVGPASPVAAGETLDRVLSRGVMVMATDADYPPQSFATARASSKASTSTSGARSPSAWGSTSSSRPRAGRRSPPAAGAAAGTSRSAR